MREPMGNPDQQLDVAGCGSMVVDLIYRSTRICGVEEKTLLRPYPKTGELERRFIGGVTLNHLGWASVLGLRVGVFGRIGDDANGTFLRDGMDQLGIEQHLTLDGSASSFACIFVNPDGNRAIYMSRGATAELSAADVSRRHAAFIRRASICSTEVSQLPLKTVIAILEFAKSNSIATVLDVDVPPSDACATLGTSRELERALTLATILKPAKAAARELVGRGDALRMAAAMRKRYGSEAVVITDGAEGCAIAADDVALRIPAYRVRAVDSTGAGDAFLGAMLAGLRWKLKWPEVGKLANAAGAVCVSRFGAFPAGFELKDQILAKYDGQIPARRATAFAPAEKKKTANQFEAELDKFLDLCIDELKLLRQRVELNSIWSAVEMIRDAESTAGRVHVTGAGKPEHVARYVASLLCSIGTPATFLHATETLHGSLGQVHKNDVVIAISNSGDTEETCAACKAIKEHGAKVIAVTGKPSSRLAREADLVLHAPVEREGGVLGLAPRISVLAQIYVLATLSVALEAARGVTVAEYSKWHQAGMLGQAARRLSSVRRSRGTV